MAKSASQIGERIKRARELRGLTQVQAGEILGVHEQTIIRWESGVTTEIKSRHLPKVAAFIGASVSDLVGGTGGAPTDASTSVDVSRDTSSTIAEPRHARNLPLAVREYLAEFRWRLTKADVPDDEIDEAMRLLKSPDVFTYFKGGRSSEFNEEDVLNGMRAIGEDVIIPRLKKLGRKVK